MRRQGALVTHRVRTHPCIPINGRRTVHKSRSANSIVSRAAFWSILILVAHPQGRRPSD